ncbi:hypothetical protein D3C87_1588190 [compost metagenome]
MANRFSSIIQMTLNSRYIQWGWQVIYNSVHHELNTFVTVGGSNDYREDLNFYNAFAQSSFDLVNCNFFTFQVLHSQVFVKFCYFLD